MSDWWRSWHGAPTDPKWILIARRAGSSPAVASAIAWALFDHASQASPRGSVTGFDTEYYAAWGQLEEDVVRAVISAMTDKGMIVDGCLANWRKRQPEREDGSAERAKAWRERNRTQPNAAELHRDRVDTEQNTSSLRSDDVPPSAAADAAADPETELFRRGKDVLGRKAGGQITKLLQHFDRSVPKARAAIEIASTKENPSEYIAAVLQGRMARAGPSEKRISVFAAGQELMQEYHERNR